MLGASGTRYAQGIGLQQVTLKSQRHRSFWVDDDIASFADVHLQNSFASDLLRV